MASFGHRPFWLTATVNIESSFGWESKVLKKHLEGVLGRSRCFMVLNVEHTSGKHVYDDGSWHSYRISYPFEVSADGALGEDAERLQQEADGILAMFAEMEEKLKAREALDEPLSWVLACQPAACG